jgi:hypothetical protein
VHVFGEAVELAVVLRHPVELRHEVGDAARDVRRAGGLVVQLVAPVVFVDGEQCFDGLRVVFGVFVGEVLVVPAAAHRAGEPAPPPASRTRVSPPMMGLSSLPLPPGSALLSAGNRDSMRRGARRVYRLSMSARLARVWLMQWAQVCRSWTVRLRRLQT